MAERKIPLSIVITTIDKATAKIQAINDRINKITSPIRTIGEKLSGLGKDAGIPKLVDGFKGVGNAISDLGGKILGIGGSIAGAVFGLKSLVDGFDDLGDLAERVGVSVDFLAQMRFAAERSGASVQQLDGGLTTLGQNLGSLRAGTGRLTAFLKLVSPALLTQLKGAKSNEQAFDLLADAMAKIEDPAKRLALAQRAVGDSALAPLLARGAKGIGDLRGRYLELAGSQIEAATAAGAVDDSMKDLKAATDGIKAALVTGLAPALGEIVEKLRSWFTENRADIAEWSISLGKKIPGAISKFTSAFSGALSTVSKVIELMGGIKVAAAIVAAVIVGPLISSIYALGVAILTTPVGWIMAAIAAIASGVFLIIKNWGPIKSFFSRIWDAIKSQVTIAWDLIKSFLAFTPIGFLIAAWVPVTDFFRSLWDGITSVFEAAWEVIKKIVDKVKGAVDAVVGAVSSVGDAVGSAIDFVNPFSGEDESASMAKRSIAAMKNKSETKIMVDFANAPRGTRVSQDGSSQVDLSVGYQMVMQ